MRQQILDHLRKQEGAGLSDLVIDALRQSTSG
jgi:hypothetical protein